MVLLSMVFAIGWFTSTAIAVHLPALMLALGLGLSSAVALGALIGPAQVGARVVEFIGLRRVHPLVSARAAATTHPLAVLALLALGPVAAPVFVILHGAGNGILSIIKGTLPLALFGPADFDRRQGWLTLPARIAQAIAPLAFGLAVEAWGLYSLLVTAALGLAAFCSPLVLRP